MKIKPALISYLLFCVFLFALLGPMEGICGVPVGLIFCVMIAIVVFLGGALAYYIIHKMSSPPSLPVKIVIFISSILVVVALFSMGLAMDSVGSFVLDFVFDMVSWYERF